MSNALLKALHSEVQALRVEMHSEFREAMGFRDFR